MQYAFAAVGPYRPGNVDVEPVTLLHTRRIVGADGEISTSCGIGRHHDPAQPQRITSISTCEPEQLIEPWTAVLRRLHRHGIVLDDGESVRAALLRVKSQQQVEDRQRRALAAIEQTTAGRGRRRALLDAFELGVPEQQLLVVTGSELTELRAQILAAAADRHAAERDRDDPHAWPHAS